MDAEMVKRVLQAAATVGLALGGCGPVVDDGAGGSSSSGSTPDGTTSGSPGTSTSGAVPPMTSAAPVSTSGPSPIFDVGDREPRFDVGGSVFFDLGGPPVDCAEPPDEMPSCDVSLEQGQVLGVFCLEDVPTACEDVDEKAFLEVGWNCLQCSGFPENVACEPTVLGDDRCCAWTVIQPGQSCPGRPFIVEGRARVPTVVERADWAADVPPDLEHTAEVLEVLAAAWSREGCHEAASVASFSRFILQLVGLGAPPHLIVQAQSAVADEVEHARVFFGLARAYGGVSVGPSELPIRGALKDASDPVAIAVTLAEEGCIAETISAMQLAAAAGRTSDRVLRNALTDIAEQELRHAELAWTALGWMLARGTAAVRSAVADVFAQAHRAVPRSVSQSDALDPVTLAAAGRLSLRERLDIAERALSATIAPAAAALLEPWTVTDRRDGLRATTWRSEARQVCSASWLR